MIESLTSTSVERTVEVILSVLLFMDALDIRDAPRRSRTPVLRALFLALPLSLIAVFFAAMYLLPDVRRTSGRGPWDEPTRVGMLRWSVGQCR